MKLSVFYEHIIEASGQTGKTVEEICRIVRGYGIEAVEIDAARLDKNEDELMEQLEHGDLKVICVCAFFDFGRDPDYEKGFDLIRTAKRTGADKVLVIPGFVKPGDAPEALLENMKRVLSKVCDFAKSQGVTVGMEDFDDCSAPFSTTEQLLWFMENVPGLRCTFDTGNFLYSEEDTLDALHRLEGYISHVHCKDRSLAEKAGENPKLTVKGRRLYSSPVGHGCIPMKEILTYLIGKGYDGTFAIEHFGSRNQLEDMRQSAKWLRDLEQGK
jgi:sugar phosphate isomerase/epimerase